jgi:hypothetical protein
MTRTWSNKVLRGVTFLVRMDMAMGILMTAALLVWMMWH